MVLERLVAIATAALLSVGNLAACAGWQATPEARMACCTDEGGCPMHASTTTGSDATRVLTQADADRCCAGATDRTSSTAPSVVVSLAALPLIAASITPTPVPALEGWRALVPHPLSPVPKHLLLTVLLV